MVFLTLLAHILILNQASTQTFDWLIGTWEGANNTELKQSFEVWEKVGEGSYTGIGYSMEDGDTIFIEKLSIENIYGVPHYTADVAENEAPVHFKITKSTASGFTCSNPQHDFPKQIEYALEGNVLTATISGDGKSRSFIFHKK